MKDALDENTRLRRRNGELIIKMADMEQEIERLKSQGNRFEAEAHAA